MNQSLPLKTSQKQPSQKTNQTQPFHSRRPKSYSARNDDSEPKNYGAVAGI